MSKSEDYLDRLLDSMDGGKKPQEASESFAGEVHGPEDDFLDSFEKEFLHGEEADDFIRQFEQELEEETHKAQQEPQSAQTDTWGALAEEAKADFGDLDDIVSSAREKMEQQENFVGQNTETVETEDGMDLMVDTMGSVPELDFAFSDTGSEEAEAGTASDGADDELMSLLQTEGDFSDIGNLLDAEESDTLDGGGSDPFGDFSLDDLGKDMAGEEQADTAAEADEKDRKGKKKKQKKDAAEPNGFFQKLSKLFFGEDEEAAEAETVKEAAVFAEPESEAFSDENMEILKTLGGMTDAAPEPEPVDTEDPKEKKKREKKEKQEKAKAEKKAKKEQAKKERAEKKAKKVKVKKPPKEPDLTPPLPKKPVILVFVMVGSFLLLVILGTDLFGYSNGMANAKKEFGLGNYEAAFQEVAGMEIKEEDIAVYEKYRLMANTAGEYSAYQSFMEAKLYDMALDSLIRAVGRCEKYHDDAVTYEFAGELEKVRGQAVSALAGFGIDETRALALFAESDRKVYSTELYAILDEAGLKVE